MTVYTINASTSNTGYVRSDANAYSNARSGSNLVKSSIGDFFIGQALQSSRYYVYQTFLDFDTSAISGTIVSAELKVYVALKQASESYTIQARLSDFGASVTTADWVAGASLSALTLVADKTSAALSSGSYNTFSDVAMVANLNLSGSTRLLLSSSDQANNDTPTLSDYITIENPSDTNPPQLVITTSDPTGELTGTLAALTTSATSTLEIAGATTSTLADLLLSSTATLSGTQEGVLNTSLGALTVSSTVAIETFGYAENTLGDVTLSTVALVDLEGALTATLGALTSESVIAWNFNGALTATLGNLALQSTNIAGVTASLTATLGALTLQAVESGPPWPVQYDFPQSPLDGTWRSERGDDTLRSGGEVGAREYRARNGGNYADVTFAIMVKSKTALDLLDRFYRDDCKNGATPFYWIDPETGDNLAWLWAAPPQIRHVARETYRVECALLKEAA